MDRVHCVVMGLSLLLAQGCGGSEPAKSAANGGSGGGNSGGANSAGNNGAGAGNNTSAGSGGSDTPLIPVVLACDKLGAVGTWERIGPEVSFAAGKETVSVVSDPNHIGTIYSGVSQAGLWKSIDCGATWAKINTGRNFDKLDSGIQWQITVDPINSDVYADSGYGGTGLYRSTNGGVDFDVITPTGPGIPNFVQGFSVDPKDHKHIVVSFHDNCTGAYAPMCFAETVDGAATWRFMVGPTKAWGEAAGLVILEGAKWVYAAPFDALYYTADSGAKWDKVVEYPGCWGDGKAIEGNFYIGCLNGLMQSPDGKTWTNLTKSPRTSAFVQVGASIYSSYQNADNGQPLWVAPVSDLTAWTNVKTPTIKQGASASNLSYDAEHHILYMAGWGGGLWRGIVQ